MDEARVGEVASASPREAEAKVSRWGAWCLTAAGVLALAGLLSWLLGLWRLLAIGPAYVPMAPATAVCLLALSAAGLAGRRLPGGRWPAGIVLSAASGVLMVAATVGAFDLAGAPLPSWLAPGAWTLPGTRIALGRMSPLTVVVLALAAVALALGAGPWRRPRRVRKAAALLALGTGLAGLGVLMGYLLQAPLMYGGEAVPMAASTAAAFVLLGAGLLFGAGEDVWPTELLVARATTGLTQAPLAGGYAAAFLIFAAGMAGIALVFYQKESDDARRSAFRFLESVADQKVRQIETWRAERLGDGRALLADPITARRVRDLLMGAGTPEERAALLTWIEALQGAYGYRTASLVDPHGRVVLSAGAGSERVGPQGMSVVEAALASGELILSDLHRAETADYPHLDLVVPVPPEPGARSEGALLFRIDAATYLFPLLSRWSVPSESGECLLIRRDGDRVLFLSAPRLAGRPPLSLSLPLDTPDLPAARLLKGELSASPGTDYRGTAVFAVGRIVKGFDWGLVAKMDRAEVEDPIRDMGWRVAFVSALLLFFGGYAIYSSWNRSEAYREEEGRRAAQEREALVHHYDFLARYASDAIFLMRADGRIAEVNERAESLYGYTREELLTLSAADLRAPEALRDLPGQWDRVRGDEGLLIETRHRRKDGTVFPVEVSSRILEVEGERYHHSVIRDVTERKQAEEVLKESELLKAELLERLNEAQRIAVVGSWEWNLQTERVWWSEETYRIFGVTPEEYVPSFEENGKFIHPEDAEAYGKAFQHSLQTGEDLDCVFRLVTRSGQLKYCQGRGKVKSDASGRPVCFAGTVMDVTDRTSAEEALRESEKRLREAQRMAQLGYWTWDVGTGEVEWSEEVFNIFALDPATYTPQIDSILALSPWPEDHERDKELIRQAMETREQGSYEQRFYRPDKSVGYYYSTFQGRYDAAGKLTTIVGTVLDITERKRAEAAMLDAEERFRTAAETSHDLVYEWDLEQRVQWFGDIDGLLGYAPGEFPRSLDAWAAALHPEDRDLVMAAVQRQLEGREPYDVEYRVMRKDGSWARWAARGAAVRAADGTPLRWIGTISDITVRKRDEDALRESELKYRSLYEEMLDGFVRVRMDGRITDSNAAYRAITGYSAEELERRSYVDLTPERWHEMERRVLEEEVFPRGYSDVYEKEYRRKDGSLIPVELRTCLERGPDGQPKSMWAIVRDVTSRVEAERALRQKDELLRLTSRVAKVGGWEFDPATGEGTWTEEVARIHDLDPEAPTSEQIGLQFYEGETRARIEAALKRAIGEGEPYDLELELVSAKGVRKQVRTVGLPVLEGGRVVLMKGIFQDITDQKLAEKALREHRELLNSVVEGSSNPIYVKDLQGRYQLFSSAAARVVGKAPAEVLGQDDRALFPPEEARVVMEGDRGVMDGGVPRTYEEHVTSGDGASLHFLSTKGPVFDESGKVAGIWGIVQDITERKRAEEALALAHARLRRFVDADVIGVVVAGAGGNIYEANDYYLGLVGYSREELERGLVDWRALTPPEWLAADERALKELERTGVCQPYEKEYLRRDGTRVSVLLADAMLPGPEPQIAAFAIDLTERKRAEAALMASEAREKARAGQLSALLDAVPAAVWMTEEPQAIHMTSNRLGAEWTRVPEEANVSKSAPEGERPETFRACRNGTEIPPEDLPVQRAARGEAVRDYEFDLVYPEGGVRHLFGNAVPLTDAAGTPRGAVSAFVDITERKRVEAEVRLLNEDLERRVQERTAELVAANHELESFAHSVSHDLRAPLRGIDGWSHALAEDYGGLLDARAKEYLGLVRGEARVMSELIDTLLNLSKVTRASMERESVDLVELARSVEAELRRDEPGREVALEVAPGLTAEGDARLLRVVLQNLLANAWKFTRRREDARVMLGAEERDGQRAFFVRDNGAGFNMAYADKLFQPFQRLHHKSEFPGVGVGLATVLRIVHRHGGEIWAEGKEGEGATFYFTLEPAHAAAKGGGA